jgi:hypothetical protein
MRLQGPAIGGQRVARRAGLFARGLWLCPATSLVLAAAVLMLFGVSWWAALVGAGLLGCLIAAASLVVADRSSHRQIERSSERFTRDPHENATMTETASRAPKSLDRAPRCTSHTWLEEGT